MKRLFTIIKKNYLSILALILIAILFIYNRGLQNEVSHLNSRIISLEIEIEGAAGANRIDDLESQVSDLESEMQNLQYETQDLEAQIMNLQIQMW